MGHEHNGFEHDGEETSRTHPFGSHFSRLNQEAQDWSTVLLGGYALGPMTPAELLQTWKQLLWQGDARRMSVYVTLNQRTIYLVGPHDGATPRGLELEDDHTFTLCGVDERGDLRLIQALPCRSVQCYLFVANTHRLPN